MRLLETRTNCQVPDYRVGWFPKQVLMLAATLENKPRLPRHPRISDMVNPGVQKTAMQLIYEEIVKASENGFIHPGKGHTTSLAIPRTVPVLGERSTYQQTNRTYDLLKGIGQIRTELEGIRNIPDASVPRHLDNLWRLVPDSPRLKEPQTTKRPNSDGWFTFDDLLKIPESAEMGSLKVQDTLRPDAEVMKLAISRAMRKWSEEGVTPITVTGRHLYDPETGQVQEKIWTPDFDDPTDFEASRKLYELIESSTYAEATMHINNFFRRL